MDGPMSRRCSWGKLCSSLGASIFYSKPANDHLRIAAVMDREDFNTIVASVDVTVAKQVLNLAGNPFLIYSRSETARGAAWRHGARALVVTNHRRRAVNCYGNHSGARAVAVSRLKDKDMPFRMI
jgi:hypothetical protein